MNRRSFIASMGGIVLPGLIVPAAGAQGSAPESSVRFVDITEQAGIRFQHNSAPEQKYIVESMSGGVALFDYDNDGWLDIYFTNALTVATANDPKSARSALYHNNRDGTFTDVTEKSGLAYPGWAMGVTAADYDGDGFQDLYVTCLGSNHLYHNNGDGTFTDVTQKAGVDDVRWSTGAAFGDFDRDGALDLFVTNYVDFNFSNLPEFGKGKFCQYLGVPVQCGPAGLPGTGDSLFRNNGDGTFSNVTMKAGVSDPQKRYGLGVVWTDVDHDGWPDIFLAHDVGPNYLYRNNRDGTFTEIGVFSGVAVSAEGREQSNMGVALGDYMHTGRFGIFISHFSDDYDTLYRQDSISPPLFTDVTYGSGIGRVMGPWLGWGDAFFDYDNDGWQDLMVVNGHVYPQVDHADVGTRYRQRVLLFHNDGGGMFSEVAARHGEVLMVPRVSRGAAFGDIDNDGDIDIVIENLGSKPTILRNDGGNQNNWITIKTVGKGLNRDAIGARVKVVSGDLTQWDEVRAGGSYLSSNDLRLHYGLAKRTSVDLIELHWPDGQVEMVRNAAINHFLTIEEGKGITRVTPPGK